MSMSRKIFIPVAGQTLGRYAAFRLNGTANYRGDTVFIDTLTPASQGQTAGVLNGVTLNTTGDFLYVKSANVANDATTPHFAVAGLIEGKNIGQRDTTTVLADDGVVIVQVAGVFKDHAWSADTTGVADWVLLADSGNTLGSSRTLVGVGKSTLGPAECAFLVGVVLTTNVATATRGTVTTANGLSVWVRCGDVV